MINIPQGSVTHHGARGARGFSIVELMVAIALALIVTATGSWPHFSDPAPPS